MSSVLLSCGAPDTTEAGVGGISSPGGGGTPGGGSVAGGTAGGNLAGGNISGGTASGGLQGGLGGVPGTVVQPGGGPGGQVCEIKQIDFIGDAPDMLIVLDRSLSMTLEFRWEPSKQAVKQITTDYEALIGFGLEMFPGDGAADPILGALLGDPDPVACAGTIGLDVPMQVRNAGPIAQAIDRTMTLGSTPTSAALQRALTILGPRTGGLDVQTKAGFVLLVTDGDPSCKPSVALDAAGPGDVDEQANTRNAVTALMNANIPTYVIGYDITASRQQLMNELAMLGGTGTYKAVGDAEGIIAAFREITKDVVRCEFDLGEVPEDPRTVRIEIDGQTIHLNDPNGWIIDGKHVTLQGTACSGLKDGRVHDLNAQVECTVVVPI